MARDHGHDGLYICIEGLDGAGTTTLAEGLADEIDGAVGTREPYDDIWTGEAVRRALSGDTAPTTDLFLFMADRSEHLERVVKPALERGEVVVSDRSAASTYAYQAYNVSDVATEEGPWSWFDQIYAPWDVEPDVTIYLDVSLDTALERADGEEKYEKRNFLKHVYNNYASYENMCDHRWFTVDAEQPVGDVLDSAFEALSEYDAAPRRSSPMTERVYVGDFPPSAGSADVHVVEGPLPPEVVVYAGDFPPSAGSEGPLPPEVVEYARENGETLDRRGELRNHSPNGFAWGYDGSGPAQLALAMLADLFGDETALEEYQAFKFDVVADLDGDRPFVLTESDVRRAVGEVVMARADD